MLVVLQIDVDAVNLAFSDLAFHIENTETAVFWLEQT